MLQRLRNAAASMAELAQRQDRVANNLANANTTGFRRDRTFQEALNERIDHENAPLSDRTAGQWVDRTAGALVQTGNALDLALAGEGFFTVQTAAGETRYTRSGEFLLDADGTVRSVQGLTLLRDDGTPLTLPPSGGEVQVTTGGEVRVGGTPVGRIGVTAFDDARRMTRLDGATFAAGAAQPVPADAEVRQGFIETANVNPVTEMADLIEHVRLFESQQKSLRTSDEILGQVTRDLGAF